MPWVGAKARCYVGSTGAGHEEGCEHKGGHAASSVVFHARIVLVRSPLVQPNAHSIPCFPDISLSHHALNIHGNVIVLGRRMEFDYDDVVVGVW